MSRLWALASVLWIGVVIAFLVWRFDFWNKAPEPAEPEVTNSLHTDASTPDGSSPRGDTSASGTASPGASGTARREPLVVDLHADTLWRSHRDDSSIDDGTGRLALTPDALEAGSVGVQFFSIWVPPNGADPPQIARALRRRFDDGLGAKRHRIEAAHSVEHAREIVRDGGVAAFFGLEGGAAIGHGYDLDSLCAWRALGARYLSVTWNESNAFGCGAGTSGCGLTPVGRELIRNAEACGLLIDTSHASEPLFWDIIAISNRPVIATHSNARALLNHARNLDDLQLLAIAESGGVVGLNFYAGFLTQRRPATVADVVAHAEHMRAVFGVDHLAFGSDFDGADRFPRGLSGPADLPRLAQALAAAGWNQTAIDGLMGENALRVLVGLDAPGSSEASASSFTPVRIQLEGPQHEALVDRNFATGVARLPDGVTFSFDEADRVRACFRSETHTAVQVRLTDAAERRSATQRVAVSCPTPLPLPDRADSGSWRLELLTPDVQIRELWAERRAAP